MVLSHTATKTQLTALKQEHEALKEDCTSLKEATGVLLLDRKSDKSVCSTTSQLLTLLVDTSRMKSGNTLSLALSESNIIILEGLKFKLNWELHQQHQEQPPWPRTLQQQYIISLYLVTDEETKDVFLKYLSMVSLK